MVNTYPPYNFASLAGPTPVPPAYLDDCFEAAADADLSNLNADAAANMAAYFAANPSACIALFAALKAAGVFANFLEA